MKTSHNVWQKEKWLSKLSLSMITKTKTKNEKMSTCLKGKKKKIQTRRSSRGKQTKIQNCISNLSVRDNELVSSCSFLYLFPHFFSSKKKKKPWISHHTKTTRNLKKWIKRSIYPLIIILLVFSGFLKQFQAFDLSDKQWYGHLEPFLQTHSI